MKSPGPSGKKRGAAKPQITAKTTSWGSVADWYEEHLEDHDTYHAKVIAPGLVRLAQAKERQKILDLGCGEGFMTRVLKKEGVQVHGADISDELIRKARAKDEAGTYFVSPAEGLVFADDSTYDTVICSLALQNMERIEVVFVECSRVLKNGGRFIFVINHPSFRIPQKTSWGFDSERGIQYRRIDAYLSAHKAAITMAPGSKTSSQTWSFHRSLQDYVKALAHAGFVMTKLEEWISHRESEKGPRKTAEDRARKEFPLFMTIVARVDKK